MARTMTADQHRDAKLLRLREYSIITMGMSDVGVLYTAKKRPDSTTETHKTVPSSYFDAPNGGSGCTQVTSWQMETMYKQNRSYAGHRSDSGSKLSWRSLDRYGK